MFNTVRYIQDLQYLGIPHLNIYEKGIAGNCENKTNHIIKLNEILIEMYF